jgi:pimeloyl-ACP methyl ester carboxylesterase
MGYEGKTIAQDIYQLVSQLGFKDIFIVGHDFGAQVAYSYAAAHPNVMQRLAQMLPALRFLYQDTDSRRAARVCSKTVCQFLWWRYY